MSRISGAIVTGGFYDTLGLTPAIGRLLTRADDLPGAPLVAVASDGYWERGFARDPEVVGRTIMLNGVPATIVGVSPRGFIGANVGATADVTIAVAALPRVSPLAAGLLGPRQLLAARARAAAARDLAGGGAGAPVGGLAAHRGTRRRAARGPADGSGPSRTRG